MINDVISPEFDENGRAMRRIRSFVRRQGRLTKGQQHALENYWPVMGVEYQADAVDLAALFGREAPTVEVLENMIPDGSLDMVQLFFPDPWHKARHNKRRIVQTPFVELVLRKLKTGGVFHMATDWQPYAEHMLEVMNGVAGYRNLSSDNDYVPRPDSRPLTKFELRGQRLGHGVWDLMFERKE
ncbi:trmB [Acinetobacter baumannii]|nr:trmB [Acinetobacter baumannii]